jgi:hypothetical protein
MFSIQKSEIVQRHIPPESHFRCELIEVNRLVQSSERNGAIANQFSERPRRNLVPDDGTISLTAGNDRRITGKWLRGIGDVGRPRKCHKRPQEDAAQEHLVTGHRRPFKNLDRTSKMPTF